MSFKSIYLFSYFATRKLYIVTSCTASPDALISNSFLWRFVAFMLIRTSFCIQIISTSFLIKWWCLNYNQ